MNLKRQKHLSMTNQFFVGFDNARPDKITETMKDRYKTTTGRAANIQLDSYQHPAKRDDPHVPYSCSFDIYSLGCVLLEIARWHLLETIADTDETGEGFKCRLQEAAIRSKG